MYVKKLSQSQQKLIQKDIDELLAEAVEINDNIGDKAESGDLSSVVSESLEPILADLDADESQKAMLKSAMFNYLEFRIQFHIEEKLPMEFLERLDLLLEKGDVTASDVALTVMYVYEQLMQQSVLVYARRLSIEVVTEFVKLFEDGTESLKKITELSSEDQLIFIDAVKSDDQAKIEMLLNKSDS